MSKKEDLRKDRFERIKNAGILRFVLIKGTLWGLIVFALGYTLNRPPVAWYSVLLLCLLGGFIWAFVMWFITIWLRGR